MVSTNPLKPSTSQGFETPTTTDLSHLAGDPFGGQSMAGGAATTEKQGLLMEAAPGSASEGTQLVVDAADHSQGGMTQVHTALDPSTPAVNHTKDVQH